MTTGIIAKSPLFRVSESIEVAAPPLATYELVSDLPRSGLWSPECRGGIWLGAPRHVGSVFRGENYRASEVVGWAPLVRGTWHTEAEVTVAEPGQAFEWAMRTHAGHRQDSIWGFSMESTPSGCLLTHHFEMTNATEGILKIVSILDEPERIRFVTEWGDKLSSDVRATLHTVSLLLSDSGAARAEA